MATDIRLPSEGAQTAADPIGDEATADHGERQTRLSAVWMALAVAVVALMAVLIFILQNPRSVELSFLPFHGQVPLGIALLFAMMLGAVVVLAVGSARMIQLRGVARRARRARNHARSRDDLEAAGKPA